MNGKQTDEIGPETERAYGRQCGVAPVALHPPESSLSLPGELTPGSPMDLCSPRAR